MSANGVKNGLHLNVTFGECGDGTCLACGIRTILVCFSGYVDVPKQVDLDEGELEIEEDGFEISEEVTAHYCTECRVMTTICLNRSRSERK